MAQGGTISFLKSIYAPDNGAYVRWDRKPNSCINDKAKETVGLQKMLY